MLFVDSNKTFEKHIDSNIEEPLEFSPNKQKAINEDLTLKGSALIILWTLFLIIAFANEGQQVKENRRYTKNFAELITSPISYLKNKTLSKVEKIIKN